ncbi:MAG TPA: alpha/beta fold hydrolase [Kouleothrix sp.]|uniref:alpha/beta fold hydrolase n=1 Tax=Kouleothrix sp. TaxID=2779161 RepID=UPI002BE774F0|nr:alpha/beta fold hydrolase [Kouleothrix sp.]HRC76180.1 alpha/beta fold hydrolase [Kouleothrix sp.]
MLITGIERVLALGAPMSRATLPLINGLARRRLVYNGVAQRETRIDGIPINYYYKAPAQPAPGTFPLLLIHGIADNALTWSFIHAALARKYPVYAVDLPGYGFSGLPAGRAYLTLDEMCGVLDTFLRREIGQPALVVGNSMGGWLAVKLAWSAPSLLRGLVLVDAGGAPLQGRDSWVPFGETIGIPDMKTARLVFRQMFGGIPAPMLYVGQHSLQELFQRRVVREFVANMMDADPAKELLHPAELRNLPVPAGLIWGMNDRFLPRGSLEFFRENLPEAPAMLLRRCGHLPQRERPVAVLHFLRMFAARLAAQRDLQQAQRA